MRPRIGKFEIVRRLGEGAMGEVFLGRDPIIGREVAIKTIRPQIATGEEARERFYREARAAGTLNHPNLVTVHEFGEDDGTLFLAMEYVPGEDLQVLLLGHTLTRPQILEIVAQVCDGLAYAHSRGVMHRDIKPSNIRVDWHLGRPFVKVMDFGIARIAGSDMTGSGTILGTFGYMAPEYIQTGIPDPRADIFACGVILYEALAGERPFGGDTTATVLYRIVHEEPKPLDSARLHGISPAVQGILDQALIKDPALRYQRPEVMAAALRSAKDPEWQGGVALSTTSSSKRVGNEAQMATTVAVPLGQTVKSNPQTGPQSVPAAPAARSKTSSKALGWAVGVGALACLGAAGGWLWMRGGEKGASTPPETSRALPAPPTPVVVHSNPTTTTASAPKIAPPESKTSPAESKPKSPPKPVPAPASEPADTTTESNVEVAPTPSAPSSQSDRSEKIEINEAIGEIESHPVKAHRQFLELQRQDPQNVKAYALDMVALYHMNHYGEMLVTMQKARANGVDPKAFRTYPRFRVMMKEERQARRIPRNIAERMKAAGHDPSAEE